MFDVIDDSGNEVMGVNGEFLKDSDSSIDKKTITKIITKTITKTTTKQREMAENLTV